MIPSPDSPGAIQKQSSEGCSVVDQFEFDIQDSDYLLAAGGMMARFATTLPARK